MHHAGMSTRSSAGRSGSKVSPTYSSSTSPSSLSSAKSSRNNTADSTPSQSPRLSSLPQHAAFPSMQSVASTSSSSSSSSPAWPGEARSGRKIRRSFQDGKDSSLDGMIKDLHDVTTNYSSSSSASSLRRGNRNSTQSNNSIGFPQLTVTPTEDMEPRGSKRGTQEDWWEHILPPGQLAERLKRAQRNSNASKMSSIPLPGSSSSTTGKSNDSPRRRSVLSSATRADRRAWTSLIGCEAGEVEKGQFRRKAAEMDSLRSSNASVHSVRSDVSSRSGASSCTEDGSPVEDSPYLIKDAYENRAAPRDRSGATSPTAAHTMSRSTSCRRSRVMSDCNEGNVSVSGSALGLGIGGGQSSDFDDRFGQWANKSPFQSSNESAGLLRPWSAALSGRHSPAYPLADTPEVSSAEEHDPISRQRVNTAAAAADIQKATTTRIRTSTTASIRTTRHSLKSTSNVEALSSPPSSRRMSWATGSHANEDRHVSFNRAVEVSSDEQAKQQTIGRSAGRRHAALKDAESSVRQQKRRSWQPGQGADIPSKGFPSSTSSTSIARPQQPTHYSNIRGRRVPCHSAPTSPQAAFLALEHDRKSPKSSPHDSRTVSNRDRSYQPPDLLLISSLSAAHNQLASAGHLALTFTRSLSVPLRPMIHLTMFISVSSFTMMALAGFLIAGYFITAWDDVNKRGKDAKTGIEASVQWCEKLLKGSESSNTSDDEGAASSKIPSTASPTSTFVQATNGLRQSTSRIVTAPLRMAITVPMTVAYKLTPHSISTSFSSKSDADDDTDSTEQASRPQSSRSTSQEKTLPPRPPLSKLLPSIFLTIMIALGAGLASFFAERAATAQHASAMATGPPLSPRGHSPTPLHPQGPSRVPLRRAASAAAKVASPQHSRRASYASSMSESHQRPYDITQV